MAIVSIDKANLPLANRWCWLLGLFSFIYLRITDQKSDFSMHVIPFRTTHVSANDGRWHHICASWENKLGSWKLYKDGFLASSGIWFQVGRVIRSGGSLALAQDQDSLGGTFEKRQCFVGMLTNVNVWNYVLSRAQIKRMSNVCLPGRKGNVYKWSDFIHGREGKARVVMPSPCKPQAF